MGRGRHEPADIARLPMAVLLIFADNDSISQRHIAEFFALSGGGVIRSPARAIGTFVPL